MNDNNLIRVNKYLANLGVCSRRDVKTFLHNNVVTLNREHILEQGVRFDPYKDVLQINGERIKPPKLVYYLLHKPKGVISTTADEFGRKNVTSLIPSNERIFPVGRLDKDTTGLLILTNDGELTNMLIHPKYKVNKVYQITIARKIHPTQLKALRNGVLLSDGITAPARVSIIKERPTISFLEMTIHEGRNRQIRRMCETVGIKLLELKRIRFGPLELEGLGVGKFRPLTQHEVQQLKKISSLTSKSQHT